MPKRSENEIMRDLCEVYSRLSPESLSADGERPRSEQNRLYKQLNRRLIELQEELGEEVTEDEAWMWSYVNNRV
jgi:hypothetical protein